MAILRPGSAGTQFLNVDLEILSKSDLQPFVAAVRDAVVVLFVGRVKRTYHAHLELAKITRSADETVREFCTLLSSIPRSARQYWSSAKTRDFNIGVQAGNRPTCTEFVLSPETVKAVSALGARLVFSVYPPSNALKGQRSKSIPTRGLE